MLNRIYYSAFVLLSLVSLSLHAQTKEYRYTVGASVGYNTFSMTSLKALQEDLARSFPIALRKLESFPAYFNYGATFNAKTEHALVGFELGHTSTGSRFYYSDYSGSLALDQVASMTYGGATAALYLHESDRVAFLIGAKGLLYFNKLKFITAEKIYDANNIAIERFNSRNLATQVFFELQRHLGRLSAVLQGGYEVQVPGDLLFQNNDDYFLVNSDNKKVKLNASGFRTSLGLRYSL